MWIIEEKNTVIVKELEDFILEQTLECGQCFRYYRIKENRYVIIARHRLLEIEQVADSLILYDTSLSDFDLIWRDYFDLDTDYKDIKHYLTARDAKMTDIIEKGSGIRILNQDFTETLISFILSQNKQIPQIKQVVEKLCVRYGKFIRQYRGTDYYDFPSVETLGSLSEEDFRECKAGFRAKYLVDACSKLADGFINENELKKLSSADMQKVLCSIKGVGEKVSNCVLLYGLRQKESFPIDVWIKRILEKLYFNEETKLDRLQVFSEERFGKYGGYAQQYLFYYSRS